MGINYAGMGVVLELPSRIEKLEKRIRELESRRSWETLAKSS